MYFFSEKKKLFFFYFLAMVVIYQFSAFLVVRTQSEQMRENTNWESNGNSFWLSGVA